MTQIQINYAQVKETVRHNVATEEQARNELSESHRHNVTAEDETHRHNLATEKIDTDKTAETKRHNLATEKETQRTNVANEKIKATQASASMVTAKAKQTESTSKGAYYGAKATETQLLNAVKQKYPNLYALSNFTNVFKKDVLNKMGLTALSIDIAKPIVIGVADYVQKVATDYNYLISHSPKTIALEMGKKYPSLTEQPNWQNNLAKGIEDALNAFGYMTSGGPITAPTGKRAVTYIK